jgi:hypothetical protein
VGFSSATLFPSTILITFIPATIFTLFPQGIVPARCRGLGYFSTFLTRFRGSLLAFWAFLSYDNYVNFGNDEDSYLNLNKYSEIVEVFFSDFSYTVNKRGGSNYDMWDVNVTLEEA